MRRIIDIPVAAVLPAATDLWARLEVPPDRRPRDGEDALAAQALVLLREQAQPRGVLAEVSAETFGEIFRGEGRNAAQAPLAGIYPRAETLVLFAATLGAGVSQQVQALFAGREFALAMLVDAAASEAAERVAEVLTSSLAPAPEGRLRLRYSPGYCGWDLSGQRALFAALRPEEIGITLRESLLMDPLKSISGVIVEGPARIHVIEGGYAFCSECRSPSCRERSALARRAAGSP
jgi:hypothetical protein